MSKSIYLLDFNRNLYQKELTQLQEQIEALNTSEKLYEELTEKIGDPIKSISDFEKYLQNVTRFANLHLAADAMGLKEEYQHALRLEEQAKIDKRLVVKKDGLYSLKPSIVDDLKEKRSLYMDEKIRPTYDKALEAVELFNSLPTEARPCLRMGLDAKWHINIHRFKEGEW